MTELEALKKKLKRQIAARKQAEQILEAKALELFEANQNLSKLNESLEKKIELRTDALNKSKLLAEQAQRAEQNFLANISHEIRTPLSAVIGMSHLLNDTKLDPTQAEYLDILRSSADLLQALIADVLDISKIDSGNLELNLKPINLPEIVGSIHKTFNIRLDSKPVEFISEIDSSINRMLIGDELLIRQVLLNLISNAEKFTKQGFIKLSIQNIAAEDENMTIQFRVTDTGIGIDTAKLDLIFEEFKQASPEITKAFGGTGLGLAITKRLIHLMGGKINVESVVNEGTTFDFSLNFDSTEVEINSGIQISNTNYDFQQITRPILIAEDNRMNQRYISKLMEKWNLEYVLADNGQIAVDKAMEQVFELIFMDIQMPLMNGHEATKAIRSKPNPNQRTTIIALTASTLLNKKQEALDIGMDDYLTKPYNPSQLLNLLKKHLIAQTSVTDNSPILEHKNSVLEGLDRAYLEETYGNDYEYAIDIFSTFIDITRRELEQINAAEAVGNYMELSALAHKIKPTFTMVGLPQISDVVDNIETISKEAKPLEIKRKIEELNNLYNQKEQLVMEELIQLKKKIAV